MKPILLCLPALLLSAAHAEEAYRIKAETSPPRESSIRLVTAEAHYAQKPAAVWDLLNKFVDYPQYLPRVAAAESLGISDRKEQLYIMMDIPWPLPDIWNILEISREPEQRRMTWEMTQGNMKKNSGSYTIEPDGDGSVFRMSVSVDPGKGLPQWLVAWTAKKFLPKILTAIGKRLDQGILLVTPTPSPSPVP